MTDSDEGITFITQRTLSSASTVSPDLDDDFLSDPDIEEGPSFRLGSLSKVHENITTTPP